MHSPVYHLLAADLRKPPAESLAPLLTSPNDPLLSPSLPTLLLFECVLVYMSPEASQNILQWFTDYFAGGSGVLGCIVYEMFALEDSFGKVMVNNLKVGPSKFTVGSEIEQHQGSECHTTWCSAVPHVRHPPQSLPSTWMGYCTSADPEGYPEGVH